MGFLFMLGACDKDTLENFNPNAPGPEALKIEEGFAKAAHGVYAPMRFNNGWYHIWWGFKAHQVMGDVTLTSVGNWAFRWANQPAQIIRSNGVILTPPVGGTQIAELNARNTRAVGSDNFQAIEWFPMYALIGHCNLLLGMIDDVQFEGDAATIAMKRQTYQAWLYWWKGYAYSRLGSIYKQGLIINEYNERNNNFVSREALIDEATRNFNLAKDILTTISETDETYLGIIEDLIPTHFQVKSGGIITPQMFIRNINTYKARNILVNKYASELTETDLAAIEDLAEVGIRETDKIFNIVSVSPVDNCFVYETAWTPARLNIVWEMISERLVQDFRPGDARRTRNIEAATTWQVNPRGRGFNYSTRWLAVPIGRGGAWQSDIAGEAEVAMATTFEENQLMLAEVQIRRGNVDAGLQYLDRVRTFQDSQLPATFGTGLTQVQALEELRSERRIALFQKGTTAFYDARRWGVLRPLAQGGGRTNAVVVFRQTPADIDVNATIEYLYKEWWDVPANETDFNPIPSPVGSIDGLSPL